MSLEILAAGLQAQVQDFGRFGYLANGVTHAGPMDEHAFLWGNHLLRNAYNATQIEITLGGFRARFHQDAVIALTGADMRARCDSTTLAAWQSHLIRAGQTLELGRPRSGLRAYLAIRGGFECAQQLGSTSTSQRELLGGLSGQGLPLEHGDLLGYQASHHAKGRTVARRVPGQFIPSYQNYLSLRFIPNPLITQTNVINDFCEQNYTLSIHSDRMGFRLEAESKQASTCNHAELAGVISHGVLKGAIQLPEINQAIVLMSDHQTMGGYPLMGYVARVDLPRLAQARPGSTIAFIPSEAIDLSEELRRFLRFFEVKPNTLSAF